MSMTQRHFEAVAAVIAHEHSAKEPIATAVCHDIAVKLADCFAEDNARFNRKKFLKACGFDN